MKTLLLALIIAPALFLGAVQPAEAATTRQCIITWVLIKHTPPATQHRICEPVLSRVCDPLVTRALCHRLDPLP